MKLRVGLVGLGDQWQKRHRPALLALADRFEVRAICGEVAHLAKEAAREFDAACVDGFRALAARDDVDAILMLAPQWYGSLPILAASDYGKSVFCASKLAIEVEETQRVHDRIESTGIAFTLELPHRFMPATLRLKELIATHLGPPRVLFCHQRLSGDSVSISGNSQLADPLLRNLVGTVDWCHYIVGHAPRSVVGLSHPSNKEAVATDYEMRSGEFPDNETTAHDTIAQISCGRYIDDLWPEAITFRPPAALQVSCERGIAFVDLPANVIWFDEAGRHMESLDSERPVGEQMLSAFYRDVTSLVQPRSSLDEFYQALRVVLAARQSDRTGNRVDLGG